RPARGAGRAGRPRPVRRAGGHDAPAERNGAGGGGGRVTAYRAPRSAGPVGTLQQGQGAGGAQSGGGGAQMTTRTAKTGDAVLSQTIAREVAKRVVAQDLMVERLLIGLLTGGHVLLEAMQEKQVTIGGETFFLGEPFLVLATQNPIEQEGTYPLPEAQLDRFMLKVRVGYPTRDAEKEIVARMASGRPIEVQRVAEA